MWKQTEIEGKKVVETDSNGNPIWINDDSSTEVPVDWKRALDGMASLRNENKIRREKSESLEISLKDLQEKIKMSNSKPDDDKNKISESVQTQISQMKAQFESELAKRDDNLKNLLIENAFANSNYIKENLNIPNDIVKTYFEKNFKIIDNKIVGVKNGIEISSQKRIGELADFEEALEIIINEYSGKNSILKGKNQSGGGATSGIESSSLKDVYISDLSIKQKMDFIKKYGQDKFQELVEKGKRPI